MEVMLSTFFLDYLVRTKRVYVPPGFCTIIYLVGLNTAAVYALMLFSPSERF